MFDAKVILIKFVFMALRRYLFCNIMFFLNFVIFLRKFGCNFVFGFLSGETLWNTYGEDSEEISWWWPYKKSFFVRG